MTDEPSASDEGNKRRLFELPEYRRALQEFVYDALDALVVAKDPVLQKIKIERREVITATATDLERGGQHVQEPLAAEVSIKFDWAPVAAGDYQQFIEALDAAAVERLGQVMPAFFKSLEGVLDAAGQRVDAAGRPVSFELILEMYEKLEIDFDENDQPQLQTIVAGPAVHEKLQKVFASVTPDQKRAFDELIERKRKEFHARRRTRRIP
jgi:hypothetical protein